MTTLPFQTPSRSASIAPRVSETDGHPTLSDPADPVALYLRRMELAKALLRGGMSCAQVVNELVSQGIPNKEASCLADNAVGLVEMERTAPRARPQTHSSRRWFAPIDRLLLAAIWLAAGLGLIGYGYPRCVLDNYDRHFIVGASILPLAFASAWMALRRRSFEAAITS